MPEHDKERKVSGEVSATGSRDEDIIPVVEQLRREISGLPLADQVVEGDMLAPRTLSDQQPNNFDDAGDDVVTSLPGKLTARHSALGLVIREKRLRKKAA